MLEIIVPLELILPEAVICLLTFKVVNVPNDVIFPWCGWVVAVSGAKPVIVATVDAWPSKVPINLFAWLSLTNESFQYFVGEPKSTSPPVFGKTDPDVSIPNNILVEPER